MYIPIYYYWNLQLELNLYRHSDHTYTNTRIHGNSGIDCMPIHVLVSGRMTDTLLLDCQVQLCLRTLVIYPMCQYTQDLTYL